MNKRGSLEVLTELQSQVYFEVLHATCNPHPGSSHGVLRRFKLLPKLFWMMNRLVLKEHKQHYTHLLVIAEMWLQGKSFTTEFKAISGKQRYKHVEISSVSSKVTSCDWSFCSCAENSIERFKCFGVFFSCRWSWSSEWSVKCQSELKHQVELHVDTSI